MLDALPPRKSIEVPPHDEAPEFFSDWGDPREYTKGDMGIGECAGEVVELAVRETDPGVLKWGYLAAALATGLAALGAAYAVAAVGPLEPNAQQT